MKPLFLACILASLAFGDSVVYNTVCNSCHAGNNPIAPSLVNNPILQDAEQTRVIITQGYKTMPPLADFLSESQIDSLSSYLQTLSVRKTASLD
ncbi:hypothetical protein AGMMS50229_07240 [Campylobacterota bacterium]|nr:hypothetical protein AGMMS50229_07240 [Campylobacterota bacterium]